MIKASYINDLNNLFQVNPDFLSFFNIYFHKSIKITTEAVSSFNTVSEIIDFLAFYQSTITYDDLSFEIKCCISRFIGKEILKDFSIKDPYEHGQIERILEKYYSMHSEYGGILKKNNPQLQSIELSAYKNLRNLLNLFSIEGKLSALTLILKDNHLIFYYKYFQMIQDNDLYSLVIMLYHIIEQDHEKTDMLIHFMRMMCMFNRFNLVGKIIEHIKNLDENAYKFSGLYLRRFGRSFDFKNLENCTKFNFYKYEIEIYDDIDTLMTRNPKVIDYQQNLQSIQNIKDRNSFYFMMKQLCKLSIFYSGKHAFEDPTGFLINLQVYLCQFSVKYFTNYSFQFCYSLKLLIKTITCFKDFVSLQTRKELAESLLGLSEMLYYYSSKILAASNLILAKQTSLDSSVSPDVNLKHYNYANECYNIASNIENGQTLCIRAIFVKLEMTRKFSDNLQQSEDYRKLMNEVCARIDSLRCTYPHKYELYHRILHLIDCLSTCTVTRSIKSLPEDIQNVLHSYHNIIITQDTYLIVKLKLYCRSSVLVQYIYHNLILPRNASGITTKLYESDDKLDKHRLAYATLVKSRPNPHFLFDFGIWKRLIIKPKSRIGKLQGSSNGSKHSENTSGTEDSESDSESDECLNMIY